MNHLSRDSLFSHIAQPQSVSLMEPDVGSVSCWVSGADSVTHSTGSLITCVLSWSVQLFTDRDRVTVVSSSEGWLSVWTTFKT